MGFLDKISGAAKTITNKTGDMVEISSLNFKINEQNDKIVKFKKELGERCWTLYCGGTVFDETTKGICESIREAKGLIQNYRTQIQEIKAVERVNNVSTVPASARPVSENAAPTPVQPVAGSTAPAPSQSVAGNTAPVPAQPVSENAAPTPVQPVAGSTAPAPSQPVAGMAAPTLVQPVTGSVAPMIAHPAAENAAPITAKPVAEPEAPVTEEGVGATPATGGSSESIASGQQAIKENGLNSSN